ncbi:hypothetical protein GCM10010211_10270 [Streptomyces albospinus]|uniref:Uncharacterized protein n=1 Tax=Streptomyces albospinus TaxID=285515 RepID=A0ABQ2URR3_9ACTN|nr:hypothetical protein [Streptomyces albospinus]GGU48050.1 hypothetical protein GCM10010211_10270 [Streptomyces albospinus]
MVLLAPLFGHASRARDGARSVRLFPRAALDVGGPPYRPSAAGPGDLAAEGCGIGGIVSSQLGHKYADELYDYRCAVRQWPGQQCLAFLGSGKGGAAPDLLATAVFAAKTQQLANACRKVLVRLESSCQYDACRKHERRGGIDMGEYASSDASAALARAEELGSVVRRGTRWFAWYQVVFGCGAGLQLLIVGLLKPAYAASFSGVVFGAVMAGLWVYVGRQPVVRRGFGTRIAIMVGAWALLYAAVLVPGFIWFQGVAGWWMPGAVAVALPGLIGGYLEARR